MALPRAALTSTTRKTPGRSARVAGRDRLLHVLESECGEVPEAVELFAEFLAHDTHSEELSQRLLELARSPLAWRVRELAVLMLEHQALKIDPEDWPAFDLLLVQLNLKQTPGLNSRLSKSVLREGY